MQRYILSMILCNHCNVSAACNAIQELNPCSNLKQAMQGLTNHIKASSRSLRFMVPVMVSKSTTLYKNIHVRIITD